MKTTMRTYWQRRVQRGAMWLDQTRPGWWHQIDLVRLDLKSSCSCIVGQLSGDFCANVTNYVPEPRDFGTALLFCDGIRPTQIIRRSPVMWWFMSVSNRSRDMFDLLTALWTAEINERLQLAEHGQPPLEPSRRERQQRTQKQDWLYAEAMA